MAILLLNFSTFLMILLNAFGATAMMNDKNNNPSPNSLPLPMPINKNVKRPEINTVALMKLLGEQEKKSPTVAGGSSGKKSVSSSQLDAILKSSKPPLGNARPKVSSKDLESLLTETNLSKAKQPSGGSSDSVMEKIKHLNPFQAAPSASRPKVSSANLESLVGNLQSKRGKTSSAQMFALIGANSQNNANLPKKADEHSATPGTGGSIYITADMLEPKTRQKVTSSYKLLAKQGDFTSAKSVNIFKVLESSKPMVVTSSGDDDYDHIISPPREYIVSIFVNHELLCSTYTFADGGFHTNGFKNRGCRPMPQWEDSFDVLVQPSHNLAAGCALCHYDTFQLFKDAQEGGNYEGLFVPTKIINFDAL